MNNYIIGIDEVGRGPLAGPVTIAVLMYPKNVRPRLRGTPLKDSKQLTEEQREYWFQYIQEHPRIAYVTAHVSPRVIDSLNITRAANRAASRALMRLIRDYPKAKQASIILDGGLYLEESIPENLRKRAKTVVRGDEKYACVRLASIAAKVTRDRYMIGKHRLFPEYGFSSHKGYGTERHRKAIKRYGLSELHRLTFTHDSRTIGSYGNTKETSF